MFDGLAHGREHRPGGIESRAIAAAHDGQRAVLGTFDATAHRCIDETQPAIAQGLRRPACSVGADRRTVDDQGAAREARREAFDHGSHVGVGGDADHCDVEEAGELLEACGRGDTEFGREALRLLAAAIPDCREQSCLVEILRHGSAHGTEARKSDALHRRGIIRCGRGK